MDGVVAHGFAQSPPSAFGDEPGAESDLLELLGVERGCVGIGLTSWNFRTCTLLSSGETPLTSRSAPIVVLVVATLTPERRRTA